ncbi:MAG: RNA polymerase factor sigma-54 [Gammaproteobacteria bacterium]|nr:RNA polymerase factor sigma-54 [Gammaproteobacteria bacterium]
MKQSLQLRLGQQLTMTPQLQQAIRMLQLSTLELQLEIRQALESNLMLEEGEEFESEFPEEADTGEAEEYEEEAELSEEMQQEVMPDELVIDSVWDDIYDSMVSTPSAAPSGDEERDFEHGNSTPEDLRDYLLWQLRMSPISEEDMVIAESIIDAINDDGLLSLTLEDLLESLRRQLPELELDEVVAVLHRVQQCDPPGVAARDLRECLLLQLNALPADVPWHAEAIALLSEHFELLAARDYTQLKRVTTLNEQQLTEVIQLIQSLNPRPGGHIASDKTEYIVPDVIVSRTPKGWRVELNSDNVPSIRVNNYYAGLIKQTNGNDAATMKNHLQEARWFIKSLQSRNDTLLKVASSIITHQRDFLEQGEVAMKPMVLHDISEELGMHESTISRTTTRKYMHTPRGIFELKYFFSSHVSTASGGEASSTAIRSMLKSLIAAESPKKPLSDNKLAQILSEKGINVARRTVAKYREAMAIPPSNERKRLV